MRKIYACLFAVSLASSSVPMASLAAGANAPGGAGAWTGYFQANPALVKSLGIEDSSLPALQRVLDKTSLSPEQLADLQANAQAANIRLQVQGQAVSALTFSESSVPEESAERFNDLTALAAIIPDLQPRLAEAKQKAQEKAAASRDQRETKMLSQVKDVRWEGGDKTSLYDKVLDASERADEELLASDGESIEAAMKDLEIEAPEQKAAFAAALQMRPLFDAGIVHQAIAQEFVARGFKKGKDAVALARGFALLPKAQKRGIVDGVVENILDAVDDKVDLSNVRSLEESASRFKMNADEYARFLKGWRNMADTGYEGAKLAVLDKLHRGSTGFLQDFKAAHKLVSGARWYNPFSWLRRRPLTRPLVDVEAYRIAVVLNEQDAKLVEQPGINTLALKSYLQKSKGAAPERFLRSHAGSLTLGQLRALRGWTAWAALPDDLQARLADREARLARLEAATADIFSLRSKLAGIRNELAVHAAPMDLEETDPSVAVSQIEAASDFSDSDETIDAFKTVVSQNRGRLVGDNFVAVSNAILEAVKSFSFDEYAVEGIGEALPTPADRVSDAQFRDIAIAAIEMVDGFTDYEATLEVFKLVCERARARSLTQATETAIKKAITEQARSFSYDEYANEALQLAAGKWELLPQLRPEDLKKAESETLQRLGLTEVALRVAAASAGIQVLEKLD